MSKLVLEEQVAPDTPASDKVAIYPKAGGGVYKKNDAGVEEELSNVPIASDSIWEAAGDLVIGTGANTAARLAKGTATHVLTMNAGATAPEWAAGGGGGGYTNLTSFVDQTAGRVFYSNTDGDVTELALGADGTFLKSNGPAVAPTFTTPSGAGDVSGPATNTDAYVPQWNGADSKALKNGFNIATGVGDNDRLATQGYVDDNSINNLSEDTTPDLGGPLGVKENQIQLDATLSATTKYSGITCDIVIGYASAAFGDLVYLANADDRWEKTDANAESTSGDVMLGIVISAGSSDGDAGVVMLQGFLKLTAWDFPLGGDALYVSETAGAMTATRPTTASVIVRVVGYAGVDADTVYFNPSRVWIETAA